MGNKAPSRVVNLEGVTLWIVANGVSHILKSGEPLRALCGKADWHKAAVTAEKPSRVCASCRESWKLFPYRRPRLQDVQPVEERQLGFPVDWAKLAGDP
jgi:hypothetical protein